MINETVPICVYYEVPTEYESTKRFYSDLFFYKDYTHLSFNKFCLMIMDHVKLLENKGHSVHFGCVNTINLTADECISNLKGLIKYEN